MWRKPYRSTRVNICLLPFTVFCLLALTGGYSETLNDDRDKYGDRAWAAEITPLDVDGVWVFEYSPVWNMDALMTGEAGIENGCLTVGGSIVVWHSDHMDEVYDLVAQVQAGERPTVEMGGGGNSQEEGGDDFTVPSVIEERCSPVTSLWYASSDTITVTPDDSTGCGFTPAPSYRPLVFLLLLLW